MVKARDGKAVRVLYCIRDDYKTHPAGDTDVLLQMVGFLKTKGIEVTICSGEEPDYSKYALHSFIQSDENQRDVHVFLKGKSAG